MEKWNGKYRIPSARAIWWDYANDGTYFITICVKDRLHLLGECNNGKMKLSTIGLIVQGCWYEIPRLSANTCLGEFIVMPNHIHGILFVNNAPKPPLIANLDNVDTSHQTTTPNNTDKTKATNKQKQQFYSDISPKAGTVATILRSFKSACTKHINLAFLEINFDWQERYWDSIIKDDNSFETIANYIINNPAKWDEDQFNENPLNK